ncbi:MAG TPA: chloride channel protein [Thermoclostridium sp.]
MSGLKKTLKHYKDELILGLTAIAVGIIVGAIETLFGRGLSEITNIRNKYVYLLIPCLPLAGMLIVFTYSKIGRNSIKGMSLIFSAAFKEEDTIPKRLVPLLMISTWLTHLFGGSAGREGAAVQIGGTVAHSVGKRVKIKNGSRILLITGMAAGFAGMFQTPVAAIFFAMEVLTAGVVEYCALFPCIMASFSNGKIYNYDWILKFILTILTVSAGFQGGEVTPLFSIGASLGVVIAPVLGLPAEFAAALGFVAVFGGGTNTVIAPVFVGAEVFGTDYLPYFFIVSAIAYVFNGNKSIYSKQRISADLVY